MGRDGNTYYDTNSLPNTNDSDYIGISESLGRCIGCGTESCSDYPECGAVWRQVGVDPTFLHWVANWFDNPNGSPPVRIVLGDRKFSAGYVLRLIADSLKEAEKEVR